MTFLNYIPLRLQAEKARQKGNRVKQAALEGRGSTQNVAVTINIYVDYFWALKHLLFHSACWYTCCCVSSSTQTLFFFLRHCEIRVNDLCCGGDWSRESAVTLASLRRLQTFTHASLLPRRPPTLSELPQPSFDRVHSPSSTSVSSRDPGCRRGTHNTDGTRDKHHRPHTSTHGTNGVRDNHMRSLQRSKMAPKFHQLDGEEIQMDGVCSSKQLQASSESAEGQTIVQSDPPVLQ